MTRLATVKTTDIPAHAVDLEKAAAVNAELDAKMAQAQAMQNAATEMLMMGLRALSQRAVSALSNLFVLLTVASCFALWWVILPGITVLQIIGLSIYSLFVLLVNIWGRQK